MNNLLGILGLGAIVLYFTGKKELKDTIDNLSGRIQNAEDDFRQLREEYDNESEVKAALPDTMKYNLTPVRVIAKVAASYLGTAWCQVQVMFGNKSKEHAYTIKKVKVYWDMDAANVDLFVPGNKKATVIMPDGNYTMFATRQKKKLYSKIGKLYEILQVARKNGYNVPDFKLATLVKWDSIKTIKDENFAAAQVWIEAELRGSNQPYCFSVDVPVELQLCGVESDISGYIFDEVSNDNALSWSKSDFKFLGE